MTHKLGLTGSIGMGKSTTARMFSDAGVPVWDADATVHALYAKDGAAVAPIGKLLPSAVENGAVSRPALKRLIAADSTVLPRIEAIVHPLAAASRQDFLASHADAPLVVFDIPLLYETGADDWLDSVLVVTAPAAVQKDRVMSRGSMTADEFAAIVARQMPDAEKRKRADHVIQTLTLEQTRQAVHDLIAKLKDQPDA